MIGFGAGGGVSRAIVRFRFEFPSLAAFIFFFAAGTPCPPPSRRPNRRRLNNNASPVTLAKAWRKRSADGTTLSLHVPADAFGLNRCTPPIGLHRLPQRYRLDGHPPAAKRISRCPQLCHRLRPRSAAASHTDKFKEWEGSIHAAMVRSGNPGAPICTDCHNPHAVIKDAATKLDQLPCKYCHTEIYTAYRGCVHANWRRTYQGQLCADLLRLPYRARRESVSLGSLGQGPEAACLGCHAGVLEAHQKWLPKPRCISRWCPARPATPRARSAESISC